MTRGKAITLAVFTAWPFLYILFFLCAMIGMMLFALTGGEESFGPLILMMFLIPLHFFTMLVGLVVIVIYLVHLFQTDRVPQDKKALWAVVLFLGGLVAMPIYWYLYIWSDPKQPPLARVAQDR